MQWWDGTHLRLKEEGAGRNQEQQASVGRASDCCGCSTSSGFGIIGEGCSGSCGGGGGGGGALS